MLLAQKWRQIREQKMFCQHKPSEYNSNIVTQFQQSMFSPLLLLAYVNVYMLFTTQQAYKSPLLATPNQHETCMMKLYLIFYMAAVAISTPLPVEIEWQKWKKQHGKSYLNDVEESIRRAVWFRAYHHTREHNRAGSHSFMLGLNKFSDMTDEEFKKLYLSPGMEKILHRDVYFSKAAQNVSAPSSFDWRTKNFVTKVKDQETCGASWAFSATGALEGQLYKKTRKLTSLSEQQLLDCTVKFGNTGCSGGLATTAYRYLQSSGGICVESSYPYLAYVYYCADNYCAKEATCSGYAFLPSGSEDSLLSHTYNTGPISIAVDASSVSFQYYTNGIYYDTDCSKTNLNHAMLVVGYGTDSNTGLDYWILKNSWGEHWGDDGYMYMARNQNNMCGIATAATYPDLHPRY